MLTVSAGGLLALGLFIKNKLDEESKIKALSNIK